MVAYSFQARFEEPIKQGFKTQTIRAGGKRRHAMVGEPMGLYVGMRTKQCRLIRRVTCTTVMAVNLGFTNGVLIGAMTDGVRVRDIDGFAIRDGFRDAAEMSEFWFATHRIFNGYFDGLLIEWACLPDQEG
jgi:hypothetical protein